MSDSEFIESASLPCDLVQEAKISGHGEAVGIIM